MVREVCCIQVRLRLEFLRRMLASAIKPVQNYGRGHAVNGSLVIGSRHCLLGDQGLCDDLEESAWLGMRSHIRSADKSASARLKGEEGMSVNGLRRQWVVAIVIGGLSALSIPCAAQTLPAAPTSQNQTPQSVQAGTASAAGAGTTPAITPASTAAVTPRPSGGSVTVGRGLPGMSSGPPLNAPMGAQPPSFNTPPVVGPLLCDPVVDGQC